jgi:DNA-directed RNA polymerase subunit E'/Rpb7
MMGDSKKTTFKQNIYNDILITKKILIDINYIGKNIKQTLARILISKHNGKCIEEGFVKPDSVKLISYSSGKIEGCKILFEVVFECKVCSPVEGMMIECLAKNVTKAGIKAEVDEKPSPLIIFLARDHHQSSKYFNSVNVDDKINVRVIGQRFELNDDYVSIIAELVDVIDLKEKIKAKRKTKPKLVIVDN